MYWPNPAGTRHSKAYAPARSRRPAWRRIAQLTIAGFLLLATACAGSTDGRPPGRTVALRPDAVRLEFALPGFRESAGDYARYRSEDGRYVEDFAEWRLDDNTTAGLTLSVAQTGAPFTDPASPSESLAIWPQFARKRPSFGNPTTARNALGPASYQRVAVGTLTCVVFVQRWTAPEPRIAAGGQATLSGYYCNPPGVLLTPDAALAVLRAVVLHPPQRET